jgi:hypothetical protein
MEEMDQAQFDALLQKTCNRVLRDVEKYHKRSIAPRNFSIKISHRGGLDVILCRDDGDYFPLSTILPPGVRFRKGKAFEYDRYEREVRMKTHDNHRRNFLPLLLHEIGHSHEPLELQVSRYRGHGTAMAKNLLRGIKEMFSSFESLKNPCAAFYQDEQVIYERLVAEHTYRASAERNAWRYAFMSMRALRDIGYDAYADINKKQLIRLARLSLRSHELKEFSVRADFEWPDIDLNPYFINKPLFIYKHLLNQPQSS